MTIVLDMVPPWILVTFFHTEAIKRPGSRIRLGRDDH